METHTTPAIADNGNLRSATDQQLIASLNIGASRVGECVQIAISAGASALNYAIHCGQILEEVFRRHRGEMKLWLDMNIAKVDGKSIICEQRAQRWRALWKGRDILFPADGAEPPVKNLTEAYIKVGILPDRAESESGEKGGDLFFRMSFSAKEQDVSKWPAAEIRAFLTKGEPFFRMYQAAKDAASLA
jgi:hypothetical protein